MTEDTWLAPDGARQLVVMWRNIEHLIPYARNARTHSDAQIAQIAGSIREFGFTNPVLIDEAAVVAPEDVDEFCPTLAELRRLENF